MKNSIFLLVILTVSIIMSACSSYGEKISYHNGNSELYYTSKVTKAEAKKLGDYLIENGLFIDDGTKRSIQLSKDGKTYQFRVVIKKGLEQDQGTVDWAEAAAYELSENVFDGAPVETHLCDEHLKTLRVVIMN